MIRVVKILRWYTSLSNVEHPNGATVRESRDRDKFEEQELKTIPGHELHFHHNDKRCFRRGFAQ